MKRGLLLAGIVGLFCVAGTASGQQASNAAGTASVQPTLQSLATDNARLMELVSALQTRIAELEKALAATGQQGVPNILGNMPNQSFHNQVQHAVQGKLNLHNYTGREVILYINGTPWTVRTNESFVWVPMGITAVKREFDAAPKFVEGRDWQWNANGQYSEATFRINSP